MNLKIEKQDNSKIVIEFTMSKEEFNESLDKAFVKNARYFKVPGFRNGKVPRAMVEKLYGESALYQSVIEDTVDLEFSKAVVENNLEVVSKPELDVKQIGKDKEFIFAVTFFVKPEVNVKKYKGLEIEKVKIEVTDEDINKDIEETRNKNARIINVDNRPLQNGDISKIDFEGFVDGVAFEGGKGENFDLTIGSGQFIPGFEDQLIGMNVGETREIKVTFPTEYHSENLAGKESMFKVKLNEIKTKELPELDNEFAKDVSEFDTLDEYKKSVSEKLLKVKENQANAQKETNIINALVENVEASIPESMIESQIDETLEQFAANLSYQGLTIEKYAELLGTNMEGIRAQFRPNAEKDVKLKLALEFINKTENVEVSDSDIDAKIDELSTQYGSDNAENLKLNDNVRKYMKEKLQQEKVLKFVIDNAIEK
ncbi:MAG: trigger factor [Clostridia bacterium]|nr:trigger factor [Clostridia bacterium]